MSLGGRRRTRVPVALLTRRVRAAPEHHLAKEGQERLTHPSTF